MKARGGKAGLGAKKKSQYSERSAFSIVLDIGGLIHDGCTNPTKQQPIASIMIDLLQRLSSHAVSSQVTPERPQDPLPAPHPYENLNMLFMMVADQAFSVSAFK